MPSPPFPSPVTRTIPSTPSANFGQNYRKTLQRVQLLSIFPFSLSVSLPTGRKKRPPYPKRRQAFSPFPLERLDIFDALIFAPNLAAALARQTESTANYMQGEATLSKPEYPPVSRLQVDEAVLNSCLLFRPTAFGPPGLRHGAGIFPPGRTLEMSRWRRLKRGRSVTPVSARTNYRLDVRELRPIQRPIVETRPQRRNSFPSLFFLRFRSAQFRYRRAPIVSAGPPHPKNPHDPKTENPRFQRDTRVF